MSFEVIANTFVGIRFRGKGRKICRVKALRTKQEVSERIRAMNPAIVPHDDDRPAYLMQKMPQERGGRDALNVVLKELAIELASISTVPEKQRREKPIRWRGRADCGRETVMR